MMIETILDALKQVRQQKPLVINITNYVVMNNTANALLAVGASPIMVHSRQEMAEIMAVSGALVINIGTFDSQWIPRMRFAIEQANLCGKPVVLDPVGCGASELRTRISREFASLAQTLIIRGNASEIIAFAGMTSQGHGVDARDSSDQALEAARLLCRDYQANVVISGAIDYVVTSDSVVGLGNGSAMMPLVTGTGCSLSALTGAFAAVGEMTGLAATAVMGIAGEMAAEHADGPGSLQMHLLDALYRLNEQTIRNRIQWMV